MKTLIQDSSRMGTKVTHLTSRPNRFCWQIHPDISAQKNVHAFSEKVWNVSVLEKVLLAPPPMCIMTGTGIEIFWIFHAFTRIAENTRAKTAVKNPLSASEERERDGFSDAAESRPKDRLKCRQSTTHTHTNAHSLALRSYIQRCVRKCAPSPSLYAACAINCVNDQRYLIDAAAGISWNGAQSQMLAIWSLASDWPQFCIPTRCSLQDSTSELQWNYLHRNLQLHSIFRIKYIIVQHFLL